jgi:hypothetical protein
MSKSDSDTTQTFICQGCGKAVAVLYGAAIRCGCGVTSAARIDTTQIMSDPQNAGIRPGKLYQDLFAPPPGPVSTEWLRQRAVYLDGAVTAIQTGQSPNLTTLLKAACGLRAAADELDLLRSAESV